MRWVGDGITLRPHEDLRTGSVERPSRPLACRFVVNLGLKTLGVPLVTEAGAKLLGSMLMAVAGPRSDVQGERRGSMKEIYARGRDILFF